MSYDTIKNGISGILNAQGFAESQYNEAENMPVSDYGNTFILRAISGKNDEDTSETLSSLVYDIQTWIISIAFPKSGQNQVIGRDDMHRQRDIIIREIDDPANWQSYARIQKYLNWNIDERENYYLLVIEVKIIDTITY